MSDLQLAGGRIYQPCQSSNVGRKKGSTYQAKDDAENKKQRLLEDICQFWKEIIQDPRDDTQLFEPIALRKTQYDMEDTVIPEGTVISRVRRNNMFNVRTGLRSPMESVPPKQFDHL